MKGVYVFLEMLPFLGMAGLFVLQCVAWIYAVCRLIKDEADIEDVLLLIPGACVVGLAYIAARNIPKALRRKR